MNIEIRLAEAGEEDRLQQVERLSGEQFRQIGMPQIADDDPRPADEIARLIADGRCWVAVNSDNEIVGYILAGKLDRCAHIAQVSVVPDHQGRGVGRQLIAAVERWALENGLAAMTLTTFTDVPWNRPLYEHLGFRVMDEQEIGIGLRLLREAEADDGLDPDIRVCMRLDLQ